MLLLLGLVFVTFLNLSSKRSSSGIWGAPLRGTPLFVWRGFLVLLHLILPGRAGREIVSEFLARESQNSNEALRSSLNVLKTLDVHTLRVNEPLPQDKNYSQNMDESRLKWLQFKKEVMEEFKDLPSFVKKYLQNAQSLIRFIGAKAKFPDGRTDEYFVMFLLSIPKRKELSVDSLKAILQGATFNDGRVDSMAFIQKYLKDAEAVSEAFSDYTEEDLRHLLTSRHTSGQYVSWLNLVLIKKDKTNPKEKFLTHIIDNEKRTLLNKELLELDGETSGPYRIKVLQSKRDYDQAKNKFHNCVRTYFEDSDQDVVTLYHEESPVLCVSFSQNFQLMQAKAPFNESPEREHVSFIKNKIKAIKKGLK